MNLILVSILLVASFAQLRAPTAFITPIHFSSDGVVAHMFPLSPSSQKRAASFTGLKIPTTEFSEKAFLEPLGLSSKSEPFNQVAQNVIIFIIPDASTADVSPITNGISGIPLHDVSSSYPSHDAYPVIATLATGSRPNFHRRFARSVVDSSGNLFDISNSQSYVPSLADVFLQMDEKSVAISHSSDPAYTSLFSPSDRIATQPTLDEKIQLVKSTLSASSIASVNTDSVSVLSAQFQFSNPTELDFLYELALPFSPSSGPILHTVTFSKLSQLEYQKIPAALRLIAEYIKSTVAASVSDDPQTSAHLIVSGFDIEFSQYSQSQSQEIFKVLSKSLAFPEFFTSFFPSIVLNSSQPHSVQSMIEEMNTKLAKSSIALTPIFEFSNTAEKLVNLQNRASSNSSSANSKYSSVEVVTYQLTLWIAIILIVITLTVGTCFTYLNYQSVDPFLFRPTIPQVNLNKLE